MKEPGAHSANVAMAISRAMQQAAMAYSRGEWAESERLCRQILAARGDYFDALNLLGIITAQTRRAEEAARLLARVVDANPGHAIAHNNYGNVLKELKRFDDALQSYERALKLKPDYADALNNRGNALKELKRLDEAVASYEQALALRPDYLEAHINRGNVLQALKRFDEALASYERALVLKPDHPESLNNRGKALEELKRFDEALASYEQALALRPDYIDSLINRGNVLQALKRFDEALACYDRALALRPEHAEAFNNRGNALKELRRLDEAVASYERALALSPDYAEAFYNRGNTLQELKRLDEAAASYERALALKPTLFGASAFERLGSLLYQLGRADQAAGVYRRWLELEPANAEAQHMYAAATREEVPQRASAQYVSAVFDRFADSFDATLERLDYAAPRLLYEALSQRVDCGRGGLVVLDVGCGTGLCGVLLRASAKFLAGVDLSSQMLARARARNLYDELFEGELCAFMASRPEEFDLVICADTLVYFGALDEPVAAARRCLRRKGAFAFTVEALPEATSTPFRINAHGRYAHAGAYLRDTMESSGFSAVQCRPVVLRKEFGDDVTGYLVIGSAPT